MKLFPSRLYKSGMGFAFWRWTAVVVDGVNFLTRLHLIQVPRVGSVMLHWINRPDPQPYLHDHPVSFVSFVLRGSYFEQYSASSKRRHIQWFNFKRASERDAHRITNVSVGGAITLVFAGPKRREWGYHTPHGWQHWRTIG